MAIDRTELIEALVSRDLDGMGMKELIVFAGEVIEDRYDSYSDEELEEHAKENYPDILEDL
jgi:hypothetical protein